MTRSPVAPLLALLCLLAAAAAPGADVIQVVRVDGSGPLLDPDALYWRKAPATAVPMLPQSIVAPTQPAAAVQTMTVRGAHNGQWFGLLLEWDDDTESTRIVVDEFGDQVAIELPMRFVAGALPSPMMGNPGGRVAILQWRAAFQHDLEDGDPSIAALYPNALIDGYPDQVLRATDARPYTGAVGVDNPISHARRRAVLDQMAEGFGTMTVKPEQQADGRGRWHEGRWRVVITHPLWSTSPNDAELRPGGESAVALAVWDGGNREVGSRKAWSPWVSLRVE